MGVFSGEKKKKLQGVSGQLFDNNGVSYINQAWIKKGGGFFSMKGDKRITDIVHSHGSPVASRTEKSLSLNTLEIKKERMFDPIIGADREGRARTTGDRSWICHSAVRERFTAASRPSSAFNPKPRWGARGICDCLFPSSRPIQLAIN